MDHNGSAVFPGKIHGYLVDAADTNFSASQGFSADGQSLSLLIGHNDIYGVGVIDLFRFICGKMIFQPLFFCDGEGVGDPPVISGKAHDAS